MRRMLVWIGNSESAKTLLPHTEDWALCDMTNSEVHTLERRVYRYMEECRQRRQQETEAKKKAVAMQHEVCIVCNGDKRVPRRVWDPARKRWKRVEGKTMACPQCISRDVGPPKKGA